MAELEQLEKLRQQQLAFAAHIKDPDNAPAPAEIEDRRMAIYRALFINNVTNFLKVTFPTCYKLLGDKNWKALVRDYYRDHVSHSPLFPDLPKEFLQYLAEERAIKDHTGEQPDPPFLFELAHYEWIHVGLKLAEDPSVDADISPNGDLLANRPITSALAWLVTYRYPVDKIDEDFQPDEPSPQPHHYLALRDSDFKVAVVSLNLVSARLFELLRDHPEKTGQEHLLAIATELNHPDPDSIIASGLSIMEQWLEKDALLGTLPAL